MRRAGTFQFCTGGGNLWCDQSGVLGNCSISCRERVQTDGEARMSLKESLHCAAKKPVMDFALCDRSLCYGCYDIAEPEHYVLREIYFDG